MKKVEKVAGGESYEAVTIGGFDELGKYVFEFAPNAIIKGKVFLANEIRSTGAELSFAVIQPNGGIGFMHSHKTNEEIYVVMSGEGEFMIDGDVFPIAEGSVIRISPNGKRAYRNTGDVPLTFMCIQVKADSLTMSGTADGVMLGDEIKW